jgi:uncharacterized protein YbaP (TraB family)
MKRLCLAIIFCLFIGHTVSAETSVWKISSGQSEVYLAGSCHLLRSSDYPLPEEFEEAYRSSDAVIFETDLDEFNKPETQQLFLSKGIYTDGTTLDKVLTPEAYGVLKEYSRDNGIPVASLNHMKPWMVIMTITSLELMKVGVDQGGVDSYFHRKAVAEGKKTGGLEEVEGHINILSSIDTGIASDFIVNSINELKRTRQLLGEVITAWRKGDETKLNEMFLKEMRDESPELYMSLITDRNNKWLTKIESYINSRKSEMVIVGVGHLVGKGGLVKVLKERGYRVEKLDMQK